MYLSPYLDHGLRAAKKEGGKVVVLEEELVAKDLDCYAAVLEGEEGVGSLMVAVISYMG